MKTGGIHHITAISSNAQNIYTFYTKVLGLRLVKKTVNFDAPDVYHLYFGNEKGEPGTILTFFPFPEAGTGMRGLGQVTKIYLTVNSESLGFWLERFVQKSVKHERIKTRFNESYITFYDPDGLQLELVGVKEEVNVKPWKANDIPLENSIRGFFGAELAVESEESIKELLEGVLGYSLKEKQDFLVRYENKNAKFAKYLDLILMKGWPEGISSAGTNHHIAFRVKDKEEQLKIREEIVGAGFKPTLVVDRFYFTSVYFREKNNILFEIATDGPGFDNDEELQKLGSSLKLPPQYEGQRNYIESVLPDLYTEEDDATEDLGEELNLFKHKFINNNSAKTYVLLHGTGGDEIEMIKFSQKLGVNGNILSIRGNIRQHELNRFFIRNDDGSFDFENVNLELQKFEKFLKAASLKYQFEEGSLSFLGFSNGANFALAYALSYPINLEKIFALHPMSPVDQVKSNLEQTEIFVTYGTDDEYSTKEQMEKLNELLEKSKAKVEFKEFEGTHAIGIEEIYYLKNLLKK